MGSIAIKALTFVATAYLATLAILFVFQSRFIYPAPQEAPPLTPGYEAVQIETEDGLNLRAFYREADEGQRTVIYFHGNGGTLAGASISNGALAEAGLGVLLVEYRGYGGNPGKPSEAGLYRDGEAAAEWLSAQGVEPASTVVVGNSIGGGVATYVASMLIEAETPPAALILIAPFTSLRDVASEKIWWLPVRPLLRDHYDNRTRVASMGDLRVLIQHGSADTLITDSHGRELAKLATNGEFQSFEGSGHSLSFEPRSQAARRDWILALE